MQYSSKVLSNRRQAGSTPGRSEDRRSMVTTLDESQVTNLDPAGLITWENGSDMRDATTYKFNMSH